MEREPALENEVVVAGAGTGKTHTLVNAYLFTLLGLDGTGEAKPPSRVLAITFTDKAAAEMRRRVALRLQALSRNPNDDEFVVARAKALAVAMPKPDLAAELESHLPSAPISTFHALCGTLLRDLALQAGIDPGFAILDNTAERELLQESAEAVVLDGLAAADPEVAALTARFQLRRVGFAQGLVDGLVAVHTLLAERGLAPEDIAPVVPAALAEERLLLRRQALRESMTALRDGTRGAKPFAVARVRQAIEAYRPLAEAMDDPNEAAEFAVAQRFVEMREPLRKHFGDRYVADLRLTAAKHLDELGAALCDRVTAGEADAIQRLLARLHERVEREKNARGVLGFGDLLLRCRDLLRDQPAVRARVKARFDRILVDEYQDTSPVQEDLVALIAEEPSRGDRPPGRGPLMGRLHLGAGRLFVVGDPKQSIYGFRGADARLFSHTLDVVTNGTDEVPATGTRRPLAKSFRSRPAILSLVNLVADATLGEGAYGVEMLPEDHLMPSRAGGEVAGALWRPEPSEVMTLDQAEAIVIARKIRELLDEGLVVGDEDEPCRARDIAVLVRRAKAAGPIARALAYEGVPAQITGGEGFFARPEVMDVVAALRLVVEPQDELATLTVLRSPLVALPDDAIVALLDGAEGWREGLSWQLVREAAAKAPLDDDERGRVRRFDELLTRLRSRVHELPVSRMVDAIIDEGGYDLAVGVETDAAERMANLTKLRALSEGVPGDAIAHIGRLWDFLDDPPQEGLAAVTDPDVDAVKIMTIHQAKGLEFPIVVIADAGSRPPSLPCVVDFEPELGLAVSHKARGISPCAPEGSTALPENRPALERVRRLRKEREMSELSRLLYVALTRARDQVFFVGEERKQGAPSLRRFLERARSRHRGAFDQLLPLVRVPPVPGPPRPLPVSRLPDLAPVTAPPTRGPTRFVPSALVRSFDEEGRPEGATEGRVTEGLDLDPDEIAAAKRRGRLAHVLLARVGERADVALLDDEGGLRRALESALRSEGELVLDVETERLLAKVERTLRGPVRELLARGYSLSFEEPLRYVHSEGAVLQGAADLVARAPGDVLVVDLKSSARGSRSFGTRLQLSAYAAALLASERTQVRYTAWVFGDAHPREAVRFDEAARHQLDLALSPAARETAPAD